MKPKTDRSAQDAKRNKIANFCGWTGINIDIGYVPKERHQVFERLRKIPDYFGDANAIDEALSTGKLDREWKVEAYCYNLNHVCGADVEDGNASCVCYFASAAQKAEALWITIGWIKLKKDLAEIPQTLEELEEKKLDATIL